MAGRFHYSMSFVCSRGCITGLRALMGPQAWLLLPVARTNGFCWDAALLKYMSSTLSPWASGEYCTTMLWVCLWQVVRQCLLENGELQPFRCLVLRLALADETSIAPALDSVTSRFSGQVTLGSYPVPPQPPSPPNSSGPLAFTAV